MVEVSQQFDDGADFASFKTYRWMPRTQVETLDESAEATKRFRFLDSTIKDAVTKQLAEKDFTLVEADPDLLVVYYLGIEDKLGRADFDLNYSAEFKNSDVWHSGGAVLVIELVDPDTDHLVWRGTAEVAPNVDPTEEMVIKNVNRATAKVFEQYPPTGPKEGW